MTAVELGGRVFTGVTATTAADYLTLVPQFFALCGTDDPTPDQWRAALTSLPGARAVTLFKLRKVDPSLTPEWVAEHVRDETDVSRVYDQFARCAGLGV
jgi:hypothetical protein